MTFSVDGGSAVPPITQDYDTQIAAAPAPTKEGHTLAGWYTDASLTTAATFPYTIKENSTLYAKWTMNEYTITVQNDGNGTASANTASAVKDTEVTLTATPKGGYRFKEWQVVSGTVSISNNSFVMPDEPVTVKAVFEAISNNNGSSGDGDSAPFGILVKALKLESKPGDLSFKDTAAHWAKDSINAAAAHGVISGYDQNSFGPDDSITREQAAIIIARVAELPTGDQALSFSDARHISPWALSGVAAAVGKSYMSSYPDNSFRPRGYTSRAEAAAIVAKLL